MSNAIARALRNRDEPALRDALRTSKVAVLLSESEGRQVPSILTDEYGVRSIVAFTGQETFELWNRPEVVGMVSGEQLPALASGQQVETVLFDPAGPVPVSFSPAQLQAIVDGLTKDEQGGLRLTGDLEVLAAQSEDAESLRQALARLDPVGVELYLPERLVGTRFVLTLAAYGPSILVADLAHRLSTTPGVGAVDVLQIDADARDLLRARLPQAAVLGSGPAD